MLFAYQHFFNVMLHFMTVNEYS